MGKEEHSSVMFLVESVKDIAQDSRSLSEIISDGEKLQILARHPSSEVETEEEIIKSYLSNPFNFLSYKELARIIDEERKIALSRKTVINVDELYQRIAQRSTRIYAPAVVYNFWRRHTFFSPIKLCTQIEKEHARVNTTNRLTVTEGNNSARFEYYYDTAYFEGKKVQIISASCQITKYLIKEIFEFANVLSKIEEKTCVRRPVTDIINGEYEKLGLSVGLDPERGLFAIRGKNGFSVLPLPCIFISDYSGGLTLGDLLKAERNRDVKFQFEEDFVLDAKTCRKLGIESIVEEESLKGVRIFERGIVYGDRTCSYDIRWRHKLNAFKRGTIAGAIFGTIACSIAYYLGYFEAGLTAWIGTALVSGLIGKIIDKESEIKNQALSLEELSQARGTAEEKEERLRKHALHNKQMSDRYRESLLNNLLYEAGLHYTKYIRCFGEGDQDEANKEIGLVRKHLSEYIGIITENYGADSRYIPPVELQLIATQMPYVDDEDTSILRKAESRKRGGNLAFYRKDDSGAKGRFIKQFRLMSSAISEIGFLLWNTDDSRFKAEFRTPHVLASDIYMTLEGRRQGESALALEEKVAGPTLFELINRLNTRNIVYAEQLKHRLVNKNLRAIAFFENEYRRNDSLQKLIDRFSVYYGLEELRYDNKLFEVFSRNLGIDFNGIEGQIIDNLRYACSAIHEQLIIYTESPSLDFSPRNVKIDIKKVYFQLKEKDKADAIAVEEMEKIDEENLVDYVLDYIYVGLKRQRFDNEDVLSAFEDSLYFIDFEKLHQKTTANDEVIHAVESPIYGFDMQTKQRKDFLYLMYLRNFEEQGKYDQEVKKLEQGSREEPEVLRGFDYNGYVATRSLMSFYRNMRWIKWLKERIREEEYCSFHFNEAYSSLEQAVSEAGSASSASASGISIGSKKEDLEKAGLAGSLQFIKLFIDKYKGGHYGADG